MDPGCYAGSELHLFRNARNWKEYLRRQLCEFIVGDVLEVGAGLGATTQVLHKSACKSWTCMEPDREMASDLKLLTANIKNHKGRSPLVECATLATSKSSSLYDSILYVDVLEHIDKDALELDLAAQRLKAGGCLIVLSPAMEWLYSPFDQSIGHYRRYTKSTLSSCAPSGLELRRLRYLDSAGIAASLANRLLMRSPMPSEAQVQLWDRVLVPISCRVDPLVAYRVGKSVLGVWSS